MEKFENQAGFNRLLKKMLLKMKLTLTILLFCLAGAAASTYSQNTRLDIKLENGNMVELVKQIEAKSEFLFYYQKDELSELDNLTVEAQNATVMEILDKVTKGTGFAYTIIDRYIVVRKVGDDFGNDFLATAKENVAAQQRSVSGRVTDSSNQPLPGVTVVLKGTTQGTVTNADGNYTLTNIPDDATLVFSFVGMRTQEVVVGNQTNIDISMLEDVIGMEEVIVVGYGTQKKINLTGSVDMVTQEQIKERPVTNISEALQGVSPNLNISHTGYSSEPGGKMTVNIRGTGSLTGDDSPYILVDGIPMDLNSINPSDIESITVLKDAAASAIYGARAPYGVILITTKEGTRDGSINIEYSNNISFSDPLGLPHMSNALNYVSAHDQASINAGLGPNFTEFNYDRIRQYMAGEIEEETWLLPNGADWAGNGIWSIAGNGNNDWMYIYYDSMVPRQKHDVSVRGGGNNNAFFISAGYLDQPDELRYGDQFYKRYNVTANLDAKPTDWLTFALSSKYIKENSQFFMTTQGWNRSTMYHNFARTNVFRPLYLPNGEFSNISYIPMLNGGKENQFGSEYILSLSSTIELIKNWQTKISYNYKINDQRINRNSETVYGTNPNGDQYVIAYPISNYATDFNNNAYNMFNIVSSYFKDINDHYFYILGGFENELNKYNRLWGNKNNILTPNVPSISTSTGEYYLGDNKTHWATQGFFGRFNYNYKEKYLLEANVRYDGSSKFEEKRRWGFFPSFSVGYNISRENFWEAIEPFVTSLKLRGSWGSLGNQNVPNYLYLSTLGIGTNLGWIIGNERPNYTTAPGLVSANLTWETSTTTNVGIDASFIKGKLGATLDLYNRLTTNMFGPSEALPIVLGTSVPRTNNATLETRGFELVLSWKDNISTEFSYNIKAYISDNISTVKEYHNPTKTLSTWYEGANLGEIWGLQTVGIYQTDAEANNGPDQSLFYPRWGAGDIQYKDMNGDNKITRGDWTADNSGDYSVIGNNRPRFNSGLSASLTWKSFDFNMFWQGVLKRDYAFGQNDMTFFGFNGHQWWGMNMFEKGDDSTLDYWRPDNETNVLGPNTDAYYPKPYLSQEDYKNKQIQTRYMQNASYFRLKNISIGYSIPNNFLERTPIKNARIYISGENLITITSLTKLIDPEALTNIGWGVGKVHPLRKVYAFGVNVNF